jgi:hypothetical protein
MLALSAHSFSKNVTSFCSLSGFSRRAMVRGLGLQHQGSVATPSGLMPCWIIWHASQVAGANG